MPESIHLPKIGMIMEDAVLTRWLVADGATVTVGASIFEMDIEKVLQDVETESAGTLHHLVGDCIRLRPGAVVACVTAAGEDVPQSLRDTVAMQWSEPAEEYRDPAAASADPSTNGDSAPTVEPPALAPAVSAAPLLPAVLPPPPLPPAIDAPPAPETFVPAAPNPAATTTATRVVASPYARRLALQLGIDLTAVTGTGPAGRITESDIRAVEAAPPPPAPAPAPPPPSQTPEPPPAIELPAAAASEPPATPEAPPSIDPEVAAAESLVEITAYAGRRRAIGERMAQSLRDSAQLTLSSEVRVDEAVRMASGLSREWRGDRTVVTLTALIIRAAARALREHPALNARLEGDRIVHNTAINIGFAADAAEGLMVPVVRNADSRPLQDVATDFVALSRKTDNNELTAIDVTDGTFTVTSLESFEVDAFTPIINPPQTAILGIGRVRKQPVAGDDGIEVGQVTTLSLTFDHRVVDGAPAARFLGRVAQLLERPYMLMES
ncbi:MAG: 2-oxo acid dehydrogenase subunit E2 [Dehalococcoidia bacterium]|jgi:pyruvate dehydrogenase E2 component (dihydrolipoamide acetyltransferase)|nr:2-oxo acid dehydrogenase subunit E2 [Dehalococcoidia bacterium]